MQTTKLEKVGPIMGDLEMDVGTFDFIYDTLLRHLRNAMHANKSISCGPLAFSAFHIANELRQKAPKAQIMAWQVSLNVYEDLHKTLTHCLDQTNAEIVELEQRNAVEPLIFPYDFTLSSLRAYRKTLEGVCKAFPLVS